MVAGFRAWLSLGYAVRRGERALRIWVPVAPSRKRLAEWEAAGAIASERPRTWFKLGPVFARSQVEPLPAPARPAPLDPPIVAVDGDELAPALPLLVELARTCGSLVVFQPMREGLGGFCSPGTREIHLNSRLSVNGCVKTLVHELSHALLRVDRREDDPVLAYAEEELVVESVAYTVCGSLGLTPRATRSRISRRGRRWRR